MRVKKSGKKIQKSLKKSEGKKISPKRIKKVGVKIKNNRYRKYKKKKYRGTWLILDKTSFG